MVVKVSYTGEVTVSVLAKGYDVTEMYVSKARTPPCEALPAKHAMRRGLRTSVKVPKLTCDYRFKSRDRKTNAGLG